MRGFLAVISFTMARFIAVFALLAVYAIIAPRNAVGAFGTSLVLAFLASLTVEAVREHRRSLSSDPSA